MKTGLILGRLRKTALWQLWRDPFECVWDAESLGLQRRLLGRVAAVAEQENIRLFLFWGTLLGHVREGRILPWDDDVDLAMIDVDPGRLSRFRAALRASGLEIHDLNPGERIIKVCDPAYPHRTEHPWTWPFVDLFAYADPCEDAGGEWDVLPVPQERMWAGRRIQFEGACLWEPEAPREILDQLYPGWRGTEAAPTWDHRKERERPGTGRRSITTDADGRKVGRVRLEKG